MSAHAVLAPEVPRLGRRARVRTSDLERLAGQWQRAFGAADRALRAAAGTLPAPYLEQHRRALGVERRETAELLVAVARVQGVRRALRAPSSAP